jgi:anti-sigma factor RsiW
MRRVNMHDPMNEILSAYVDGELSAAEAADLERHVETCDDCAATVAGLRRVVAEARALPTSGPAADLWPGIAAAIAEGRRASAVLPLDVARQRRLSLRSRFSLSVPQLAAAAVILMSFGGAAVWWMSGGPSAGARMASETAQGVIVQGATAPPTDPRLVATQPAAEPLGYEADIAVLERSLAASRERLDPATIEIVERSLEAIDDAIAAARSALEADPSNPHLQRQLESTMQKKLAVLRRASGSQRGGV